MSIVVTCPSCSANIKAPDAAAGNAVKCPKCTSTIEVPAPEPPPAFDDFTDEPPAPVPFAAAPWTARERRTKQLSSAAGRLGEQSPDRWPAGDYDGGLGRPQIRPRQKHTGLNHAAGQFAHLRLRLGGHVRARRGGRNPLFVHVQRRVLPNVCRWQQELALTGGLFACVPAHAAIESGHCRKMV